MNQSLNDTRIWNNKYYIHCLSSYTCQVLPIYMPPITNILLEYYNIHKVYTYFIRDYSFTFST